MQFDTYNMPGLGLRPLTLKSQAWNRTGGAVAVGEVVMTDTKATVTAFDAQDATHPATTTQNRGSDNFPLNNVITPTTAGLGTLGTTATDPGYWFGVVTGLGTDGTGANNTRIEVTWQGPVLAKMAATASTPQYGNALVPANGVRTLTLTTAAGGKIVARLEQDTTTANALAFVLFDGLAGFGVEAAS